MQTPAEIWVTDSSIDDKTHPLDAALKEELLQLRKEIPARMIIGNKDKVYYELWGFLDVRLGVVYTNQPFEPEKYHLLKPGWYHQEN